ncbi:AAA+ ATPase domain-containing protein OS=Streptomyces microflavus OX=1919 GN=Smic_10530 PE=3 SV=1 [Streptomyces microflavus]
MLTGFGSGGAAGSGAEALVDGDAALGTEPADSRESWAVGDAGLLGDSEDPPPPPAVPIEGARCTRTREPPPFPAGPSDPVCSPRRWPSWSAWSAWSPSSGR